MWAIGYWLDNFLPLWPETVGPDRIKFDININVGPGWFFRKAVPSWSWTKVKR